MKGLSSGALHSTTSFAHPSESFLLVRSAVFFIISPMSRTASMSMPVLVDPILTEEQMREVTAIASGMDFMSNSSARVIPLETIAEYPPIKFTPSLRAARSSVRAILTKSELLEQQDEPTMAMGVTDIRLLTIGTPNSRPISSPVLTSDAASLVNFA